MMSLSAPFLAIQLPATMGQQLNKTIKRRRRKLYQARKKALAKSGLSRKSSVRGEPKAAKKTAKKPAAPKKAPAAAKAAKPEAAAAPAAEVTAPAAE